MSEVPSVSSRPEKWAHFSKRELCDIHHACDMLLKHPYLTSEERPFIQVLAGEAWAEHCRRLATPKKIEMVTRERWTWTAVPSVFVIALIVFVVLRLT